MFLVLQEQAAFGDDRFSGPESGDDLLAVADTRSELYLTPFKRVVGFHNEEERNVLIVTKHRRHGHEEPGRHYSWMNRHAHVEIALENLSGIRDLETDRHRARARIDERRDVVDTPRQRLAGTGDDIGRIAEVDGGEVGLEDVGHDPDARQVG